MKGTGDELGTKGTRGSCDATEVCLADGRCKGTQLLPLFFTVSNITITITQLYLDITCYYITSSTTNMISVVNQIPVIQTLANTGGYAPRSLIRMQTMLFIPAIVTPFVL